ncbi:abortive infection system antitoxin AbiGi family protein [Flagellimonas aequoris]|uniref:Abortive phage resistance protein AbiGi, antitoxin n=1 Tax=Flagellimonas aequoris TaxID=2306997 RepID=A0A418N5V2_9FLAO|nr:abortive infection system antitoxin AbiGi family protein [Allomuricauda aequoris]RIV69367.1 hypothetical protein D2U88_13280 [Allomuricauda aequoris]TXK01037.1 hypothetical protein FQ019_13155 [Allomuricauda aequoris]
MKEINQIIHLTESLEVVKSILRHGFFTSYTKESFHGNNILIPMISFANILFRDIGKDQVVDYGKYGIVFERDSIVEKFDLNPVFYVKNHSELETTFKNNFENSIVPQILDFIKDFQSDTGGKNFLDHIKITPLRDEIRALVDSVDNHMNDAFIDSIKKIFERYYSNSLKQVLLLKPYRVQNKNGERRVAYNEREWRKSFFELAYISELNPNGKPNPAYSRWVNTPKPHFTDRYVLDFDFNDIQCIYVDTPNEIQELQHFIADNFKNKSIEINTLEAFKKRENTERPDVGESDHYPSSQE